MKTTIKSEFHDFGIITIPSIRQQNLLKPETASRLKEYWVMS